MKTLSPIAALAAGMLVLGACGDDSQMAGEDSLQDTQRAERDDYSSHRPTPDPNGSPSEPPASPNSPPPTLPPT